MKVFVSVMGGFDGRGCVTVYCFSIRGVLRKESEQCDFNRMIVDRLMLIRQSTREEKRRVQPKSPVCHVILSPFLPSPCFKGRDLYNSLYRLIFPCFDRFSIPWRGRTMTLKSLAAFSLLALAFFSVS